jgi:lipopolysaccharide transport system permease protein
MQIFKQNTKMVIEDLKLSLINYRCWLALGIQDVKQRYSRSSIGAFWFTINSIIWILVIGFIFSKLFKTNLQNFLPYFAVGYLFWNFIVISITEGSQIFIVNKELMLNINLPISTHILRVLVRNIIIFFHNIVIIPPLFFFLSVPINYNILWVVVGFLLLIINLFWIIIVCAIISTRFRDFRQILLNFLQIFFYLTPILWYPSLVDNDFRIYLNPFLHLINVVREPILGNTPSTLSIFTCLLLIFFGGIFALNIFKKAILKIQYWL